MPCALSLACAANINDTLERRNIKQLDCLPSKHFVIGLVSSIHVSPPQARTKKKLITATSAMTKTDPKTKNPHFKQKKKIGQ